MVLILPCLRHNPSPIVGAGDIVCERTSVPRIAKTYEIVPFGIGTPRNIDGAGRTERRVRASHFSAVLDHHYPQP
jgi:hypothetical protein